MEQIQLQRAIHLASNGEWDACHRLVQDQRSHQACWLHALLHRIEGDLDNAAYWYRKAGREPSSDDPQLELLRLQESLRSEH